MVSPMPSAVMKFSFLVSHRLEVAPTVGLLLLMKARYKQLRTKELYQEHAEELDKIAQQVKAEWHKLEAMLKAGDFIMALWKMLQYLGLTE